MTLDFADANSTATFRAAREFYVEVPGEAFDAFYDRVEVIQHLPLETQCGRDEYVWRFERSAFDTLLFRQKFDLCTQKELTATTNHYLVKTKSTPAAIVMTAFNTERIHLFYRNQNDHLGSVVWYSKPIVDDPLDLGGTMTSAPTVISPQWNELEVFYRGADGRLIQRTQTIGTSWGPEVPFDAWLESAPSARTFRNKIDVVVFRGTNHHLWTITRDRRTNPAASWGPASDLGGVEVYSAPGISEWHNLQVRYRGPNSHLWESTWNGDGWWSAPNERGLP